MFRFFIAAALLLLLLFLVGCATTDNPTQWTKKCYAIATPPFEKCIDVPVERPQREPREHFGRGDR
jgi:PBP1b-binding outer membrane lipoprotein LpoB